MFDKRKLISEMNVRFYKEDYDKLRTIAEGDGLPLATWVRKMLLDLLKKGDKDES